MGAIKKQIMNWTNQTKILVEVKLFCEKAFYLNVGSKLLGKVI
jgi:hypothetical protein